MVRPCHASCTGVRLSSLEVAMSITLMPLGWPVFKTSRYLLSGVATADAGNAPTGICACACSAREKRAQAKGLLHHSLVILRNTFALLEICALLRMLSMSLSAPARLVAFYI